MTALQSNIFGQETYVGSRTKEAEMILEKYPAYRSDVGGFLFACLKHRYPEFSQMDERIQGHLREFMVDVQSLDRRRRELNYLENSERW